MRKIDKEMQKAIECMKSSYNNKKEGRFTISEEKKIADIIKNQMLNSIKEENKRSYFNKIKH